MRQTIDTIFSSAPIQTPETIRTLPERYFSLVIPAYLHFARTKLFVCETSKLIFSFNGVGTSIQNVKNSSSGKYKDLYSFNSAQIDSVKEWLYDNFGIEDFEIWRDDSLKFHRFLDKFIPTLFQEGLFNIENRECNMCGQCGNIISLSEAPATNNCNSCTSSEIKKERIDCLCINTSGISESTNISSRIINPTTREFRASLKQRFNQIPATLLASRNNREGGYPLDKYGLNGQQLDPEIAIALFPIMSKNDANKQLIVQGSNTADKAIPFTELLDPRKNDNSYLLHTKLPQKTVNRILDERSPFKSSFLRQYLPAYLANSSRDLTNEDLDKLWNDFLNKKSTIQNFALYSKTALERKYPKQYLIRENADQLCDFDPESTNLLTLHSKAKQLMPLFADIQKGKSYLADQSSLLPITETVYGSNFEVDPNSTEAIIYDLKIMFKEDIHLAHNILALLHFGSSYTNHAHSNSDIDIHLVVKEINLQVYQSILSKIKTLKARGVNVDFSMHAEYEFFNSSNEFVFRHGRHGDNFIYPLSKGKSLLGRNVYEKMLNTYFYENGYIKPDTKRKDFNDSEIVFKEYFQELRKWFISETPWSNFKKFLGRAIGTFMYSQKLISISEYNSISSSYEITLELFLDSFPGIYSRECIQAISTDAAEFTDDYRQASGLIILEDLNRIINNPNCGIPVKDQSKHTKIPTRAGNPVELYRNKLTGTITKVGDIRYITKQKITYHEAASVGFKIPDSQTGLASISRGYIVEESFGDVSFGQKFDSSREINTQNLNSDDWNNFTARICEHFQFQLEVGMCKPITSNMSAHLNNLGAERHFSSELQSLLPDFLTKLLTRLNTLPIVASHNDIHPYNVMERGIVDWEHFGNNYLGYDVLIPFYFSGSLESGNLIKQKVSLEQFEQYLHHLDLLSTRSLNIEISQYFEDFYIYKIAILCLYISDKEHLISWRYPLFEEALKNYLKGIPNKQFIFAKQ